MKAAQKAYLPTPISELPTEEGWYICGDEKNSFSLSFYFADGYWFVGSASDRQIFPTKFLDFWLKPVQRIILTEEEYLEISAAD